MDRIAEYVDRLWDAGLTAAAIDPLTAGDPELSVDDAYTVQEALLDRRLANGERIVGAKLGLTSKAKQITMGVHQPVFGWLTDAMLLDDAAVDCTTLIHPRVEPEIALILATALEGPRVTPADVLAATGSFAGAVEVIDSRFHGYSFRLPDVVADNTSAARFALGSPRQLTPEIDLRLLGCVLESDGSVVSAAAGAAVANGPLRAVALLVEHLATRGRRLEAGWVVMTGGLTDAVPLAGHVVSAGFDGLGRVTIAPAAIR